MEESLGLLNKLKKVFECKEVDVRGYSPLALAYIGDCIFELIIRTVVVERGNRPANSLHKTAVRYVNAGTQAAMADALQEDLTEEELAVYRRGKNAKPHTTAKNSSVKDYRKATGLEAVMGYLYLQDKADRVIELTKIGLHKIDMSI